MDISLQLSQINNSKTEKERIDAPFQTKLYSLLENGKNIIKSSSTKSAMDFKSYLTGDISGRLLVC